MTMINLNHVNNKAGFEMQRRLLASKLYSAPVFDRGEVHAQKVTDPNMATRELRHVNLSYTIPDGVEPLQKMVMPNLPWAEDHFQERISGEPLNPPPSNEWWPFNRNKNAEHKGEDEKFSHTYPERIWPRYANPEGKFDRHPLGGEYFARHGIRYPYGDLHDLVEVLIRNPRSRQAFLPIWFPEDLAAAERGDRVPCTIGYHFMLNAQGGLDCFYPMRSCDFLRFMVDDIYMAARLTQHIVSLANLDAPGNLYLSISSLHVFKGDDRTLALMIDDDDDDWLAGR